MFPIYSVLICPNLKFSIPSLVLRSVHGLYDDFLLLFLLKRDIYDFRYFVLVWIYAFLANLFYFILSKTFHLNMDIMFFTFIMLSCYIFFFFSWSILKRGIHDMDCFICVSMHEFHLDLYFFLYYFSLLSWFDYFVYVFLTHCFTLGIHVLVCIGYGYWDLVVFRCLMSFSACGRMIRFRWVLWVLCKLCLRVLVVCITMFCHKIVKWWYC